MSESMKFGPKWLRNMSEDTGSSDGVSMRYPLPEHRYGREEMLALYDTAKRNLPDILPRHTNLFVAKMQSPLAMTPDEDNTAPSIDRARRGREAYYSGSGYQRFAYTEGGRVRSSWSGSPAEGSDSNRGVGSGPRTEYISQLENWRKGCPMDEEVAEAIVGSGEDETRRSNNKWSRPQSWREDDPSGLRDFKAFRSFSHSEDRPFSKGNAGARKRLGFNDYQNMPEWALEKSPDGRGSFDGTGAFHGSHKPPILFEKVKKLSTSTTINDSIADRKMEPVAVQAANTVDPSANYLCQDRKKEEETNLKLLDANVMQSDDINKESLRNEESFEPQQQCSLPEKIEQVTDSHNIRSPFGDKNNVEPEETVDHIDCMKEIADNMVEQLFIDDDIYGSKNSSIQQQQSNQTTASNLEWLYRDPQGNVQGPFSGTEMAEWYRTGFFDEDLYVRRVGDTRYAQLGLLIRFCGNALPFEIGRLIPPLHQIDLISTVRDVQQPLTILQQQCQPPNPHYQSQYQSQGQFPQHAAIDYQMQLAQKQNLHREQAIMMQQQHIQREYANIVQKLTSNKRWTKLTPQQQNLIFSYHVSKIPQHEHNIYYNAANQTNQQQATTAMATVPSISLQPNLSHQAIPAIYRQSVQQRSSYSSTPSAFNPCKSVQQQQLMNIGLNDTSGQPAVAQTGQVKLDNDPIKNCLLQIMLQKGHQKMTPPTPHSENRGIGVMASGTASTDSQMFPHQMRVQTPMNMWDIPMPPSKMKTESQIIEEQMSNRNKELQQELHQKAMLSMPKTNLFTVQHQNPPQLQMQNQQMIQQQVFQQKKQEIQYYLQLQAEKQRDEQVQQQQMLKMQQHAIERNEILQKNDENLLDELNFFNVSLFKKQTKNTKGTAIELLKQIQKNERQIRLDEVNQRLYMEEKKRLEDIVQQRKHKFVEGLKPYNQPEQHSSTNLETASVAPWSSLTESTDVSVIGQLSLAEIQNAERERRAEQSRVEQLKQSNETELLPNNSLKWNLEPQNVKSLAEIQAEENKRQQELESDHQKQTTTPTKPQFATIWKNNITSIWNSNKIWGKTSTTDKDTSKIGFWDQPAQSVKLPPSAQNVTKIQRKPKAKPIVPAAPKSAKKDSAETEFTNWCYESLSAYAKVIDVPTFVTFLKQVDSPCEVNDYIRTYLGETDYTDFAKNFLERRNKFKSMRRTVNAQTDDLCQPAPAITPSNEVKKSKNNKKEKKKNKMSKFDSRILGFSVTAARDRLNIGDLDHTEAT